MKRGMTARHKGIPGAHAALIRASRRAFQRSLETGTPFFVMRGGRIVNLNPTRKPKPSAR